MLCDYGSLKKKEKKLTNWVIYVWLRLAAVLSHCIDVIQVRVSRIGEWWRKKGRRETEKKMRLCGAIIYSLCFVFACACDVKIVMLLDILILDIRSIS